MRLFLLAPRPKSCRHHVNKDWAWFEATLGQTIPAMDNLTDQLDEIAGHFRRQRNVAQQRVKFEHSPSRSWRNI